MARLADIDPGVRRSPDGHSVDQHVLGLDRVDPVGAVLLRGSAGPFDPQLTIDDAIGALGFDAIATGVLDGKALEPDIISGDEETLTGGHLAREREEGGVGTCAP